LGYVGANIVRTFLFCIFFGIGVMVLTGSVLSGALQRYYLGKSTLNKQQQQTGRLETLINDYNVILAEIERNPDFAERIAPAILGNEPNDADTIYPRASSEQLSATRDLLRENPTPKPEEPAIPKWLSRCSKTRSRIMLFLVGAALILVSFVYFGPSRQKPSVQQ